MSVAFWYPVDGQPWHGSGHYSIHCDWVPLEISSGYSKLTKSATIGSANVSSAFALLVSVASLCLSFFVGYKLFRTTTVRPYTTMDGNLQHSSVFAIVVVPCTSRFVLLGTSTYIPFFIGLRCYFITPQWVLSLVAIGINLRSSYFI